ncbi:hypothetical protein STSP2_03501 [Anaerohalosphaera lusitana]|uniref:Rubrerythrin diiron-binding domain-containing protein n=1 Tax=Anaerohalosphaera lusitana TaxID=1936003 RepID=A0A1U9NR51_9BACT|nr:demethoxyubiquinone hydroxylase family protein [Anaerohalosphaera lusitana]AQT70295.1 hypothetical protein STSP2_03501 [Anaerohalosphaera lusitana]
MPEFPNPFSGKVPDRKLTDSELARAIRLNIAAELEAIHLYEAHADATDNALAAAVLRDVADEERVHVGEFQKLLKILLPDEQAKLDEGEEEVEELAAGEHEEEEGPAEEEETKEVPTIGDIRED